MALSLRFRNPWYLRPRFFGVVGGLVVILTLGHWYAALFSAGQVGLALLGAVLLGDAWLLNRNARLKGERRLPALLSMGDENQITLSILYKGKGRLRARVHEELPKLLQRRNVVFEFHLQAKATQIVSYTVRPLERGDYPFGRTLVYLHSAIGLVERCVSLENAQTVKTYPSIRQMRQYELMLQPQTAAFGGLKKVRRLGQSYEFDQIKQYVQGDNYRSINWKATGRRNELMVNQYQEERSQAVYSVIDCSRPMQRPFDGLRLMDYAVNTSLVMANIALNKYDKAGLITYREKMGDFVAAQRQPQQLRRLLEHLYRVEASDDEADYDSLYLNLIRRIPQRSLLLWYTDLPESPIRLEELMRCWRRIARQHLLVLYCFQDTELLDLERQLAESSHQAYEKVLAGRMIRKKRDQASRLKHFGLSTVLTTPQELSLNSVNQYLALKARGRI